MRVAELRLMWLGRQTRQRGGSGILRAIALFAGVLCVEMAVLGITFVAVAYSVKIDHGIARMPQASEEFVRQQNILRESGKPLTAPFQYGLRGDRLADGHQFDIAVVQVGANSSQVTPPPGLSRWPAPGEVFLSPALLAGGADEDVHARYGRLVGEIGPDGLTAPDERFAYVNPRRGTFPVQSFQAYERFGGEPRPWFTLDLPSTGETGYIYPASFLLLVIVSFIGLPGLALSRAAVSIGLEDRRTLLLRLRVLGARPAAERWFRVGEVLVPWLIASSITFAMVWLTTSRRQWVPLTGFELPTEAYRAARGTIIFVALAGCLIALAAIGYRVRRARGATRLLSKVGPAPAWVVLLYPVAFLLTMRVPDILDPPAGQLWQLSFTTLSLLTIAALPLFLIKILGILWTWVGRIGRQRGNASLVIGAGFARQHPYECLPLIAVICLSVGLLFQSVMLSSSIHDRARLGQVIAEEFDQRLLVADYNSGLPDAAALINELHGSGAVLVVREDQSSPVVVGTCKDFQQFLLPCRSGSVKLVPSSLAAEALWPTSSPQIKTELRSTSSGLLPSTVGPVRLSVLLRERKDIANTKSVIIRNSWPNDSPASPAFGFTGVALADAHQAKWLTVFGIPGIVILFASSMVGSAKLVGFRSEMLSPVYAMTGSIRPALFSAGQTLLFIPAISSLTALMSTWLMAQSPIQRKIVPDFPSELITSIAFGTLFLSLLATVWGIWTCRISARTWRPGR